jgi:hypothetical protein
MAGFDLTDDKVGKVDFVSVNDFVADSDERLDCRFRSAFAARRIRGFGFSAASASLAFASLS